MFDSQIPLNNLNGLNSALMANINLIRNLSLQNDFDPEFNFKTFIEQLAGGEAFLHSNEIHTWFNQTAFPLIKTQLLNFLLLPAYTIKNFDKFTPEQLVVAKDYLDNLNTVVDSIDCPPKTLFSESAYSTYQKTHTSLLALTDDLEDMFAHHEQHLIQTAQETQRKIREWDDKNDLHVDNNNPNIESEQEEAHAKKREKFISKLECAQVGKGKTQLNLAPFDQIIEGFVLLLSESNPIEVKIDLINCLLESYFYIRDQVHNPLSLDYGDTNIFQAIEQSLEKASFIQFVAVQDDQVISFGSVYPDSTDDVESLLGLVVPKFEIGYTPANLRKILELSKLRQKTVCDIIGKSRSVLHRYTLESDNEKHISMANEEWVKLLEHIHNGKLISA